MLIRCVEIYVCVFNINCFIKVKKKLSNLIFIFYWMLEIDIMIMLIK